MMKIILIILSLCSSILASPGISRALEIDAQNPKSFSDLGVLVGVVFFIAIAILTIISYFKDK